MQVILIFGALLALLAVILGAFGAHALTRILDAQALVTFDIGVRYQMYHALALLLLPALSNFAKARWLRIAGWLLISGCVLFSGSLYLLAITGEKWLGPITPLGGLCFMLGWLALVVSIVVYNVDEVEQ